MDVDRECVFDLTESASKSRNSPFGGWRLKGKATATIANGMIAWADEKVLS
jgi:dihydroorotase